MKSWIAGIARTTAFGLITLFGLSSPVHAQAVADRVPADALIYLGWNGSMKNDPLYAGSRFKNVLDASAVDQFGSKTIPQLLELLRRENQDAAGALKTALDVAKPLLKYPTAIFVEGVNFKDLQSPPEFRVGLVSRAGPDAPGLQKQIEILLADSPDPETLKVRSFVSGQDVAVVIGYADEQMALAGDDAGRPKPLSGDLKFKSALSKVQSAAQFTAYFNVELAFEQADTLIDKAVEQQAARGSPLPIDPKKILDLTGLRGIKHVILTKSFDGQDWVTKRFVAVPGPRQGLLSAFDHKPVSLDAFDAVPADATFFVSGKFDGVRFLTELRKAVNQIDPWAGARFDSLIDSSAILFGANIQEEILQSLGEDYMLYCSPTVGGTGILGTVVVNKLREPAKAKQAIHALAVSTSNWTRLAMRNTLSAFSINYRMIKIGDLDVFYIALPAIAPSFAIKDGHLFAAFYPQHVAAAARRAVAKGPSIASNPAFVQLIERLGVKQASSYSFNDLPRVAGTGTMYTSLMTIARYGGLSDLFNVNWPEPLIPPLDILQANLTPSGSASWSDDDGFHTISVTPFPLANLLDEHGALGTIGAGPTLLAASILLPSLDQAQESANRARSAHKLRQIGLAALLFSYKQPNGRLPDDFGEIILNQDIDATSLVNPRLGKDLPNYDPGSTLEQRARWAKNSTDYVWLGKGKKNNAPAQDIIAYENPKGLNDGIHILFGDGRVEFVTMERAFDLIKDQTGIRPSSD